MSSDKTYTELIKLTTYTERLNYLQTGSMVGEQTFGSHRYLNQRLYSSPEWKETRNRVILRDGGNDLGIDNYPIEGRAFVHHINPLSINDLTNRSEKCFDMNNLILVSFKTHQAIHYGADPQVYSIVERSRNDTCPWRKE